MMYRTVEIQRDSDERSALSWTPKKMRRYIWLLRSPLEQTVRSGREAGILACGDGRKGVHDIGKNAVACTYGCGALSHPAGTT